METYIQCDLFVCGFVLFFSQTLAILLYMMAFGVEVMRSLWIHLYLPVFQGKMKTNWLAFLKKYLFNITCYQWTRNLQFSLHCCSVLYLNHELNLVLRSRVSRIVEASGLNQWCKNSTLCLVISGSVVASLRNVITAFSGKFLISCLRCAPRLMFPKSHFSFWSPRFGFEGNLGMKSCCKSMPLRCTKGFPNSGLVRNEVLNVGYFAFVC